MKPDVRRLAWIVLSTLLIGFFSAALLAHAYIGFFTRLISDDYDTAGRIQTLGFWGSQLDMYLTWAGRYAATFAVSVAELFGPRFVPILPSVVLATWLTALLWAIYQLRDVAGWPRPWPTSVFLAELIPVTTIVTMPSVFHCLYWRTGALAYTTPLVLLTLYAGLLFRVAARRSERPRRGLLICSGLLAFVAGGFVEPATALQGGALMAACLFSEGCAPQTVRRALRPYLLVGLAGTALATIAVLAAPGNEARIASSVDSSGAPPPRTLLALVHDSLRFGYQSLRYSVLTSRPTTAAAVVLPALIGFFLHRPDGVSPRAVSRRKLLAVLGALPIVSFLLIALCHVPNAYASAFVKAGYHPQARTFGVSQFAFFCTASLWGYLAGLLLSRVEVMHTIKLSQVVFWTSAAVAALLLVVPLNAARRTMALAPIARAYVDQWEEQDRAIRTARLQGIRHVVVAALPGTSRGSPGNLYFGLRLLGSDPEYWTNKSAADYYDVESITAR